MTTSISRTIAICVLACAALTGCGNSDSENAASGSDGDSTTTTSITATSSSSEEGNAAGYQTEVNSICAAGNERIEALFSNSSLGPDATEPQLIEMLDRILAELNGQMNEIDALDAPEGLATGVDAWLAESRSTAEEVRANGAAFFDQQASGENPFAAVNATAIELGFNACGE